MNPSPEITFDLVQGPVCAAYCNGPPFRNGAGAIPAMPTMVLKGALRTGNVDFSDRMLDTHYCSIELYDETGHTRLPDNFLSGVKTALPRLIPSFGNPGQHDTLFILGEIVIAAIGTVRLRVILHENSDAREEVSSVISGPIEVVDYAAFPGQYTREMMWTPLSRHLHSHGIPLHRPLTPDGLVDSELTNGIDESDSD